MFKWLPKKFRTFMRCGVEVDDAEENNEDEKAKEASGNYMTFTLVCFVDN